MNEYYTYAFLIHIQFGFVEKQFILILLQDANLALKRNSGGSSHQSTFDMPDDIFVTKIAMQI